MRRSYTIKDTITGQHMSIEPFEVSSKLPEWYWNPGQDAPEEVLDAIRSLEHNLLTGQPIHEQEAYLAIEVTQNIL